MAKEIEEIFSELKALSNRVGKLEDFLQERLGYRTYYGYRKASRNLQKERLTAGHSGAAPAAKADTAATGGGMSAVLDLSGDLKVTQLALMRLGTATIDELAEKTGFDRAELKIYLKTLNRQRLVVVDSAHDEANPRYRCRMEKAPKKSTSLLDKLG